MRSRSFGIGRSWSSQRRRSCASAMAWNVPAATWRRTPSRVNRSPSSPAALRVNVTASVCPGSMCACRACQAMRRVRTRVLPAPAPARIASGTVRVVTASRCASSRPSSNWSSAHSMDHTDPVRQQPRTVPDLQRRETGKAPSSLRCVAAPISSGPRRSDDCVGGPPAGGVPLRLRPGPWRRITPTFGHRPTPRTRIPAAAYLTSPVPCPCHRCQRTYDRVRAPSRAFATSGTFVRCTCRATGSRSSSPTRSTRFPPTWPRTWTTWRFSSRTGRPASSSAAAPARSSGCTRASSSPTGRR